MKKKERERETEEERRGDKNRKERRTKDGGREKDWRLGYGNKQATGL